ncbi:SGNH/GDSL hydrolase family protein [Kribbella swartbergensis]
MSRSVRAVGSAGLAALALLTMVTATGADATSTAGAGPAAPPTFKNYVALGDNYTAAPLVPPLDLSALGCMRSGGNYPALLGPKLKVPKVTDVSCAGADTTHVKAAQATPVGFVPPQAGVLTKQTDLVTIGIGANDFAVFPSLLGVCPTLQKSEPTGAPCAKHFTVGGKDVLKESIARMQTRLTQTLKDIKALVAPKATIVLIGYPQLAPPQGTCPELPLAKGDYAYVNAIQTTLNTALTAAAKAAGARYLDVFKASAGHDICKKTKAWVQGKDLDLMKAASYHPLAIEQTAVADLIVKLVSSRTPTFTSAEEATWHAEAEKRANSSAALLSNPATRQSILNRLQQGGLFTTP